MTQRAISFEADLDISDVTRGLNRIEMQARRAGGVVGRVGGGLGRGARGAGGVVGRGAGLGAGAAIFEQAIMKILELFEGTDVLETFTEALDTLFKGFGPVIGVLIKSLTPVIKALTPAIVPLAKALTPLIELFGAGLLVAVELLTPAIVLFAGGLEKVTTFIKNTVLAGFRFIVEQLNKLPFVDIQADLSATGGSFDAMAVQIETAGMMAATATPAVAGLAAATDAEKIAADKAKIATDLWAQAARENEAAAKPLTTALGTLSDEMDETYTATDSLGVIIGKTAPQVSELTTLYIEQNTAATNLTPVMSILSDEMDEAYTATDNLGVIIGASKGPAADLAAAVDTMTMEIEDAQIAADLNTAALAALSPELIEAATQLGLFGLRVEEVADIAETALSNIARGSGGGDRTPGGLGFDRVSGGSGRKAGLSDAEVAERLKDGVPFVDPYNGTIYYPGGGEIRRTSGGQSGRDLEEHHENYQVALDAVTDTLNATEKAAARAEDTLTMNAAALNATEAAAANLENRLTGNTLVNSLNTTEQATQQLDAGFASIAGKLNSTIQETVTWETVLADIEERILATARAEELQAMALAALSPELRALAEEFGLFGLRVAELANQLPSLGSLTHRQAAFDPRLSREQREIEARLAVQENNRAAMEAAEAARLASEQLDTGGRQRRPLNVLIDGESVATAITRAASEGVG